MASSIVICTDESAADSFTVFLDRDNGGVFEARLHTAVARLSEAIRLVDQWVLGGGLTGCVWLNGKVCVYQDGPGADWTLHNVVRPYEGPQQPGDYVLGEDLSTWHQATKRGLGR